MLHHDGYNFLFLLKNCFRCSKMYEHFLKDVVCGAVELNGFILRGVSVI